MTRQLFPNRDRTIAYLSRSRAISSSAFSPVSVPPTHARTASDDTARGRRETRNIPLATTGNNTSNVSNSTSGSTSASSFKANLKRMKASKPKRGATAVGTDVELNFRADPVTMMQTHTEAIADSKPESTMSAPGRKRRDSIVDLGLDSGIFRFILGIWDSDASNTSPNAQSNAVPTRDHTHQEQHTHSRHTSYFRSRSRTRTRAASSSHAQGHGHARRRSGDSNSTASSKSRKSNAAKGHHHQHVHVQRKCKCGKDHGVSCESCEPLLTEEIGRITKTHVRQPSTQTMMPPGLQRRTANAQSASSVTSPDGAVIHSADATISAKQMSFKDKRLRRRPDSPAPVSQSSSRDHFKTRLDAMSRKDAHDAPPVPQLFNADSLASLSGSATLASSSTTALSETGLKGNSLGRSLRHASSSTMTLSKPYIRSLSNSPSPPTPPIPSTNKDAAKSAYFTSDIPPVPPIPPEPLPSLQSISISIDPRSVPVNPRAASMYRRRRVITAAAQQIIQHGHATQSSAAIRPKTRSRDKSLPRIPSMISGTLSRNSSRASRASRKSRRKSRPTSMGKESIKERGRKQRESDVPPLPPLKDWPLMLVKTGIVTTLSELKDGEHAKASTSKQAKSNTAQPNKSDAPAPTSILKRSQPASASNTSLNTPAIPDFLLQSREPSAPPTPAQSTPSTPTSSNGHFAFFPKRRRAPGDSMSKSAAPPPSFSIARLVGLRGRPRRRSSSAGDLSAFVDDTKRTQRSVSPATPSVGYPSAPASALGHASSASLSSPLCSMPSSTSSPATSLPDESRSNSRANLTVPKAATIGPRQLSRSPSRVLFPRRGETAPSAQQAQESAVSTQGPTPAPVVDSLVGSSAHSVWMPLPIPMPRRRAISGPVALSLIPLGSNNGGKTKIVDTSDVDSDVMMRLRKLKAH